MWLTKRGGIVKSPHLFLRGEFNNSPLSFFGGCVFDNRMICCEDNVPHKLPTARNCECGGVPLVIYDGEVECSNCDKKISINEQFDLDNHLLDLKVYYNNMRIYKLLVKEWNNENNR